MADRSVFSLTRTELASFLNNDQDLIRRFEAVFSEVGKVIPDDIKDIQLNIMTTENKTQQIIDSLDNLADKVEMLALKPPDYIMDTEDDIQPSVLPHEEYEPLGPL